MSRKHSELEREFIDELALRTGRTLAEWMGAIDGTGISDRNAIIDWLRPQGLTFAHASWLERIHHNGGRPIYLGVAASPPPAPYVKPAAPMPPTSITVPEATLPAQPPPKPVIAPKPQVAFQPPRIPAAPAIAPTAVANLSPAAPVAPPTSLASLLARGKGLRPLADHVLREITAAVAGAKVAATGDLVSIAVTAEFAVLAIGPRELRLGLALGAAPLVAAVNPLLPSRIAGTAPAITHMIVLNDARQIDANLVDLVKLAASRSVPI